MAFPTTGILDNFDRANANPLDGNWTNAFFEDFNIQLEDNQIHSTNADFYGGARTTGTYGPDCEVYITCASDYAADGVQLLGRVGGTLAAPDGYGFYYDGTITGKICRYDDGAETMLDTAFAMSCASGDKLGLEIIGDQITAYKYTGGAWTELAHRHDSTYTAAGYLAIEIRKSRSIWDNVGGGTVVEGGDVVVVTETTVEIITDIIEVTVVVTDDCIE